VTRPRVRVCRDCCCGTSRKHPGVDHDALLDLLVTSTTGVATVDVSPCLLACEKSNVVVVQPGPTGREAGGPGLCDVPASLRPLVTTPGVLGEAVL
jgi:hypothetical protein